jgi:Chlorophyll A-B binding protein
MTVVTNDLGQTNIFAKEPKMYVDPQHKENGMGFNERNEILNGRLAMLGVVAALGAYALTGQILPGIW